MVFETACDHCGGKIRSQHDTRYGGMRGKCTDCGVDFPLE